MGFFDFFKDKGAKIFGSSKSKPETAAEAAGDAKKLAAFELRDYLISLGLYSGDLVISVNGDSVSVSGQANNKEHMEKVILALGNVEGVGKVDSQMTIRGDFPDNTDAVPEVAAEPESTFYTVKSGDSLSKIAKQYYGNANKYMAIFEANTPMLKNPDLIYPGQVLRIPPQA